MGDFLLNEYWKVQNKPRLTLRKLAQALVSNQKLTYVVFGAALILLQLSGVLGISRYRAIGVTLIYSMAALGFCMLLGYSGLASLGTAGFMGLGSYVTYLILHTWQLPFFVAVIAVIAAALLLGVVVGFISLRIQGIFLAIITLGLSQILVSVFIAADGWTNGTAGASMTKYPKLLTIQLTREGTFILVVAITVLLMIIMHNLMKSPTGRAMLAMKNSTAAAQAFGISLLKYRLFAFVLSTVYAALAGMLYMCYMRFSNPNTWSLALSLSILGAIIIGSTRSIWGAVAGVFLIFGLDQMVLQNIEFFRTNPNLIMLFTGTIIILIVMFFSGGVPQAVSELVKGIKKQYGKWKVRKYGG